MIIITHAQGTQGWLDARKGCDTASEAPAAAGESKYQQRQDLLRIKATGLDTEHNIATQSLFAKGHKAEADARPFAEEIVGEELFPITAMVEIEGLKLLASLDGLTMSDVAFEHKLWSEGLAAQVKSESLEPHYTIQMDQQCLVTGAKKVLFMTSDGTKDKMAWCWYTPTEESLSAVVRNWQQFHKDLAAYVPETPVEKVAAAEVEAFPVPSIQVKGELVACNLAEITPKFDKYLAETKTQLVTDQDFADGEANAKASREAAKNLKLTAKAVVDQITPISEAVRTLEQYAVKFDALGLTLEKAVKEQKDAIKTTAILKAKNDWNAHIAELEIETKPIRLNLLVPDFAQATKGVKTIKSLHSNIADALAKGKSEAEAAARDIRAKLTWCKENADGYGFLFTDLAQIITKPMDDFQLVVKTRIDEHKRLEAEKEAKIKADAEEALRVKLAAEEAEKVRLAEAKAVEDVKAAQPEPILDPAAPAIAEVTTNTKGDSSPQASHVIETGDGGATPLNPVETTYFTGKRPTAQAIVQAVAKAFATNEETAAKWIIGADYSELKLAA